MPRTAAPRTTRSGHLHARDIRQVPITAAAPAAPCETDGRAPLARIQPRPAAANAGRSRDIVAVVAKLDGGRLYSRQLVTAAGWAPDTALQADVSFPQRVRLRPAPTGAAPGRPVTGSSRPHTDHTGRILITAGLRSHLRIDPSDDVLAVHLGEDVIEITPLTAVIDALDTVRDTPTVASILARR